MNTKRLVVGAALLLGMVIVSGCTNTNTNSTANTASDAVPHANQAVGNVNGATNTTTSEPVYLYFYNPVADAENDTLEECHSKFVESVETDLTYPEASLETIFSTQFEHELTPAEVDDGFVRDPFDTYDFSFDSVTLEDGVITVSFTDDALIDSLTDCEGSILVSVLQGIGNGITGVTNVRTADGRINVQTN